MRTECLADVVTRMLPYWYDAIVPDLRAGSTVLVAAHGNSLRALIKHLDGMDSLLSIVQMPSGVPVATVSVGGALNAGLLAARILGAGEGAQAERLRGALAQFRENLRDQAHAKGAALRDRRSERG